MQLTQALDTVCRLRVFPTAVATACGLVHVQPCAAALPSVHTSELKAFEEIFVKLLLKNLAKNCILISV
jgi:hypothetical protein